MRATRFPLHLPVRYRSVGDADWHQGQTENISHTGALFRVEAPLPVDTRVEFRLVLSTSARGDMPPSPVGKQQNPEVFGLGRIVRTVAPTDAYPRSGFALAIEQYEFLPPPSFLNSPDLAEDRTR
jgi:hypothetical protein